MLNSGFRFSLRFCAILLLLALCALPALAETVSGRVWIDKDLDGYDGGEKPLPKAVIDLVRASDGQTIASVQSASDGSYAFEDVSADDYYLQVTLPSGYNPSVYTGDNALYPAQGNECRTGIFTLSQDREIYLGATKTSVIFGFTSFVDSDQNGGRKQSEAAVKGILVQAVCEIDGQEWIAGSATTDKTGVARIRDLSPGTYRIKVTLPENYIIGPLGLKINQWYNCINPSDSSVAYSDEVQLTSGSLGMGIGVVKCGSAKGKIHFDGDMSELSVELINQELNLTRRAEVSQDGDYAFDLLQPGTYQLHVTLPDGFMFADKGLLKNGYSTEDFAEVIVTESSSANIGDVYTTAASSLRIDINGCEQGAQAEILVDGKTVAAAQSDENGIIRFPAVRSGSISVRLTLPGGLVLGGDAEEYDFISEYALQSIECTCEIYEEEETLLNALALAPCTLSGRVYADENNDGTADENEAGIGGFTVLAINENGTETAQAQSDENGLFTLSPLLPGDVTIRLVLNDPYIASESGSDNAVISRDAQYGETDVYTLSEGEATGNIQLGVFKASCAFGYVLVTGDGLATNQGGQSGVTVTLLDENGEQFSEYTTTQTDESGYFFLKGILPGTYSVLYELPEDTLLYDSDETIWQSEAFTAQMGSESRLTDVGIIRTATVSGTAAYLNAPAYASISLTNTETGMVYETETEQDGTFCLSYLRPGTYQAEVCLDDGYVFSYDTCSLTSPSDTSISSGEITLSMGEVQSGMQIIAAKPGIARITVYFDEYGAGERTGDETLYDGFELCLLDSQKQLITTLSCDENGQCTTPALIPGSYYLSADLDSDTVFVGSCASSGGNTWYAFLTISDDGETEFELGVLVYGELSGQVWKLDGGTEGLDEPEIALYRASNPDEALQTCVPDADGRFSFTRLEPDEYFVSAVLPEGHLFARSADTSDEQPSIILADTPEGETGKSAIFYLSMGEKAETGIGFGATGTIGDFAWLDENNNGMQDIGEKGIPGIRIQMYKNGELAAECETDAWGHYRLADLYPGEYTMVVTMYEELKATVHQTEFPLVNSIMPQEEGLTVTVEHVIVPSGGHDWAMDLGFALKKSGVYPDVMNDLPSTDWSWGGTKNN